MTLIEVKCNPGHVSFYMDVNPVSVGFTCVCSSDGQHGYQAIFILLKMITQTLSNASCCAAINTNELIFLRNYHEKKIVK